MNNQFSLSNFLKQYRLTMADVVLLSIIESILFVAQFYFIGKAINDLLEDSWSGIHILITLFIGKVIISFIKKKRIGKAYKAIYEELIVKTIGAPLLAGEDINSLVPKSTIIHHVTDFFKSELITGFETVVRLAFVLTALLILNSVIFAIALGLALVVFLVSFIQKKRTLQLSKDLAHEFVKEHKVLKERSPDMLYKHHQSLGRIDNQLISISAINLSIIEVLSFAFLIVSLVVLVGTDKENAMGTFFTMLYYVMAFSETMFLLPSIYQKYLRIQAMSTAID